MPVQILQLQSLQTVGSTQFINLCRLCCHMELLRSDLILFKIMIVLAVNIRSTSSAVK
jgi:hypothetical protein